ncbi:uncharacterized protein LOC125314818 [Rhodamnia argentea]|uniref:Uncharacterized protein LOC125314818 n=1 Tax=Rhodamnia argentea TaxID=178133 RepID=A0ABM3HBK4_9MYRT|nr:uncharacterized protein LOC125314818 [Rhodamnia argentea]
MAMATPQDAPHAEPPPHVRLDVDSNSGTNPTQIPAVLAEPVPEQQKKVEDGHYYRPLLRAAFEGDWETANRFFVRDIASKKAIITSESQTALHIAAMSAQDQFVKNLVELLSPEELEVADGKQCTAIHYAALGGRIRMVKALVRRNPKLTHVLDGQGFVPLRRFAEYGAMSKEVAWFLAMNTTDDDPSRPFSGTQGFDTILYLAYAGHHGVPVDLNSIPDENSRISVPPTKMAQALQIFAKLFVVEALRALKKLPWNAAKIVAPPVQSIHDAKLRHKAAVELAKLVCAEISYMKTSEILTFFKEDTVIFRATSKGIVELLEICLKSFPELIWTTVDGKSWLTIAVEHRQEEVCRLFLAANSANNLCVIPTTPEDAESKAMLQAAAQYSPNFGYLSNVPEVAFQMQRELQWFKAVESCVHPFYKIQTTSRQEGNTKVSKTYWHIFLDEHKELLKNGQKWMKSTPSSFLLISTLIAMALFVAALIVSGGNNDSTRVPILLGKDSLVVFAITDALGLFFSMAAILSFSAILTSSCEPEDFLYSLPKKMIIGLSSLFFSLAFMLASFAAALAIVLDERLDFRCFFKWLNPPLDRASSGPERFGNDLQIAG